MISTPYCHQERRIFKAPLTGRSIEVNESPDKHLLPAKEGFSASAVQGIGKEFLGLAHARSFPFAMPTDRDLDLLARLSKAKDRRSYAAALDEISSDFDSERAGGPFMETLRLGTPGGRGNGRAPTPTARKPETAFFKMSHVLVRLWSVDQLGICPKWGQLTRQFCEVDKLSCGTRFSLHETLSPSFVTLPDESARRRMSGMLMKFAACSIGVAHVDDLTPGAVPKHALASLNTRLSQLLKLIRANQCLRHDPATVPQTPLWHGKSGKAEKGDHQLAWASPERQPDLERWHAYFVEWISRRASPGPGTSCAEFVLNYLIDSPQVTRSPEEFLSRAYDNPYPLTARLAERFGSKVAHFDVTNLCHEFFDWILIEKLSFANDLGRPVPSPNHWNPVSRLGRVPKPVQTHREAIPTRFIREMVNIITEDDYAWPKSIDFDYFPQQDQPTGEWRRVWCPARAIAMQLKLLLPLRTYQVCMLDSGELDEEVFGPSGWVANSGTLTRKGRRSGALRKFKDSTTGRVNTGFFINTNKTADRGKESNAIGYEIPWQNQQAIDAISKMATWQAEFNPLRAPQRWIDIRDKDTRLVLTEEDLKKRGDIAFLFRDPTGKFVNDPLSTNRVINFWMLLLKELEQRLAGRGETMPDGSPVKFTTTSKKNGASGASTNPLYDLHSLRVSLITSLATEGGVPIPILSKCIAGHASILMTLYYVKIGAAMVNEELALAQKRIDESEQANFKRFIFEREAKAFRPFVLTNDEAGLSALESKSTHLWSINDKGICPVGGSLCHIGGPKTSKNIQVGDYAPVPGGSRNCVRCRFFVTGPAFLGGLVAHFNAVGIELTEAADRHRAKEAEIAKLEDELYEAGGNDQQLIERIKLAQDRLEDEMKEVDSIASNWHATYAFIERSKAILAQQRAQPSGLALPDPGDSAAGAAEPVVEAAEKLSLVLGGDEEDFAVAMQESTRFEALNAVCQMSVAYPAEKAIPLANLRRSRLLDAMLSRNGCKPVFATLTDDEAIAVGNQLSSLLLARLGRAETANLIEGRRMLESSGIAKEVDAIVRRHTSTGFRPASIRNAAPTPITAQPKRLPRPKKEQT